MASGDTKTEALLNVLGNGGDASQYKGCCNTKSQNYILDAIDRIQNVEDEVEELKNNPDVVDIVDTYADLQAYDTQHLTENDIIRVLQDETHSGNSTYYRFTKNPDTWTFIGEISGGGGVNVVQTPGSSQTDVMSQNATSSMVFADPDTQTKIKIGAHTSTSEGNNGIEIGNYAQATQSGAVAIGGGSAAIQAAWAAGLGSVAIGSGSIVGEQRSICIGQGSRVDSPYSITIGPYSKVLSNSSGSIALGCGARVASNQNGLIEIGVNDPDFGSPTNYGYGNTIYRLIRGLHDGQEAHDAVTVGQVNSVIDAINTALSTNIPHIGS